MSPEKIKELYDKFPKLYKNKNKPSHECPLNDSFPGNGWFDLIYEMSEQLEKELTKFGENHPKAVQVKQKYGMLRVYMSAYSDPISAIITKAETKSVTVCEGCGEPAKREGWNTRCGWCWR